MIQLAILAGLLPGRHVIVGRDHLSSLARNPAANPAPDHSSPLAIDHLHHAEKTFPIINFRVISAKLAHTPNVSIFHPAQSKGILSV